MSKEQQNLCTVPTLDLIWAILGDDKNGLSCAQIPHSLALVLKHKLEGSRRWIVVDKNIDDTPLDIPMLWRFADWTSSHSLYKRQKLASQLRVLEHNLMSANVKMLAKAIMKKSPVPEQAAQAMAYNIIKSSGNMPVVQFFGVVKLKTEEKDLE